MTNFRRLFGNIPDEPVMAEDLSDVLRPEEKRIEGKIIHVEDDKGYGFISSPEIKFTRIFFHWTGLIQDTLNFTELKKGMKVEFTPKLFDEKKWRAIKIKVLPEEEKQAP